MPVHTDDLAPVRAYTKKELTTLLNMDHKTLARYLNGRFLDELEGMGYRAKDRKLTVRQVRFLFERMGWPGVDRYRLAFPNSP